MRVCVCVCGGGGGGGYRGRVHAQSVTCVQKLTLCNYLGNFVLQGQPVATLFSFCIIESWDHAAFPLWGCSLCMWPVPLRVGVAAEAICG